VPCSMLLSMSMLNLQLQGRTERRDWAVGGATPAQYQKLSDNRQ